MLLGFQLTGMSGPVHFNPGTPCPIASCPRCVIRVVLIFVVVVNAFLSVSSKQFLFIWIVLVGQLFIFSYVLYFTRNFAANDCQCMYPICIIKRMIILKIHIYGFVKWMDKKKLWFIETEGISCSKWEKEPHFQTLISNSKWEKWTPSSRG